MAERQHSRPSPLVTEVKFTRASRSDLRAGLLGWASCRYGDLRLDGLAVRRTRAGRIVVTYPARVDGRRRQHALVRPVGDAARQEIEAALLRALSTMEGAL